MAMRCLVPQLLLAMANNNKDLFKYMGLAMQIMVGLSLFTYLGHRADKALHSHPILVIVCPVVMLIVLFYKIYKDSTRQ
jgi:hypothetical protein